MSSPDEISDEIDVIEAAADAADRYIRPQTIAAVATARRALEDERAWLTNVVMMIEDRPPKLRDMLHANIELIEMAISSLVNVQPVPTTPEDDADDNDNGDDTPSQQVISYLKMRDAWLLKNVPNTTPPGHYTVHANGAVEAEPALSHQCAPPDRNSGTTWHERRWECNCGKQWISVKRIVGRQIRSEWVAINPPTTTTEGV